MSDNSPMLSLTITPAMIPVIDRDRTLYSKGQLFVFCVLSIPAWWWRSLLPERNRLLILRPVRSRGDEVREVDLWVPIPSMAEAHAIGIARVINELLEPPRLP